MFIFCHTYSYAYSYSLNYDECINEVKIYIKEKKFLEAEKLLNELNKKYPNNSEIYYLLGKVLFFQQKYEEALKYLKLSYQINPTKELEKEIKQVELAKMLKDAEELEKIGNYEEAKKIYLSLYQTDEKYESGYRLGMIYFKEKNNKNAEKIFEELIKFYPEDIGFKELYLEALILQRKYEEAQKFYNSLSEDLKERISTRRKDLLCQLKTNYFKIYSAFYNLSPSGWKSEKLYGFEISQRIKKITLIGGLSNIERFGLKDTQLHLEIYPPLGEKRWGYISFYYSPSPEFLPKTVYSGEIYQGYKNFEFSFGYMHMDFKDTNVDIFIPGLIIYLPHNLVLEEKFYYIPKTYNYSLVNSLVYEILCKLWVKYSFGIGNTSEKLTTYGEIFKYNTYFHKFEFNYRINHNFGLGVEYLYEHRTNLYNKNGINFFIKYWW